MAPRLESFFRETASGLRRNGVVAFAAMSTSFIALFLFGLSLLIAREFELVTRVLTGNVEVQVYLTDPVNEGTVGRLTELQQVPAVADVAFWDKERSCQEFQRLFEGQEVFLENVDCMEVIPTSLRVNLSAVTDFEQITASLGCQVVVDDEGDQHRGTEPGVRNVADYQKLLDRLDALTRVLSLSVFGIAVIMLASAIGLVANTLRMGMFARRKRSASCDSSGRRTGGSASVPDRGPRRIDARSGGRDRRPVPREGLRRGQPAWHGSVAPLDQEQRRRRHHAVDPRRGGARGDHRGHDRHAPIPRRLRRPDGSQGS